MDRLITLNCRWMFLSCLLVTCLLTNMRVANAQQFPYTAYVSSEQAYVRSGPGQRYYPTGQIAQGYAVEVYRHDEQGWCAIRPPEGSFSWLPSHEVRPNSPGVVEVVGDRVVARVGSRLSPDRSSVQVLLPRGELVELVASTENDDPRWTRIAAPAGEFRWIAASQLSRLPPMEAKPLTTAPNAFDHLQTQEPSNTNGLQFETPVKQTLSATKSKVDPNAVDVVAGSPAQLQLAQFQSQTLSKAPPALLSQLNPPASSLAAIPQPTSSQPRVRFDGVTSVATGMVSSVEELELQISQTVVRPPQEWKLDSLVAAANKLLAETKTPSVRAQLREVQERLARFQQVQNRYNNPTPVITPTRNVALGSTPAVTPTATLASVSPATNEEGVEFTGQTAEVRRRIREDLQAAHDPFERDDTSTPSQQPLYAAAGLLKPVVSKRAEAPKYALVDEQGKVVSFVTPTPDLNLKPYLGRRIGVHGTRGFMPEYRRAHVTAGRVTPIEGTIRR